VHRHGKTVADTSRMKFFSDEFYVKSAQEMRELFADVPEACDNTLEIVKRIDLKIPEKISTCPTTPCQKRQRPTLRRARRQVGVGRSRRRSRPRSRDGRG